MLTLIKLNVQMAMKNNLFFLNTECNYQPLRASFNTKNIYGLPNLQYLIVIFMIVVLVS